MSDPRQQEIKTPFNEGAEQAGNRPSGQDRQEQYQRTRDQSSPPQPGPENLRRGTPGDREDRIRQRAHEMWEAEGRPEGQADRHWNRAAEDLDREDASIQREGIADEKPGVRPKGDASFVRDKT